MSSAHEPPISDEMWAHLWSALWGEHTTNRSLPRRLRARLALRRAFPALAVLAIGVAMVVLAAVLFGNAYAAGCAALAAGGCGFLVGFMRGQVFVPQSRVGYLRAEREAAQRQRERDTASRSQRESHREQ